MAFKLPPIAHDVAVGLGRIGYKALSSGVKVALGELAQAGEAVVKRVRDGEAAADRMARGEPYRRYDEIDPEDHTR